MMKRFVLISVMVVSVLSLMAQDVRNEEFTPFPAIKEATNVSFKFDWRQQSDYNTQLGTLLSGGLENLPDGSFDLITMWHVLEHVDELKWQITQLQRLIKSNGRIIIAVPNYKSYDGQYYKEHWAAYDVPRHLNHFNKQTITKIFKASGLELKKTDKLIWDAYYISYMSEQYKHHKFPLIKGAYRGLVSNCKARRSGEWSSMVYIFKKKREN